MDTACKKIAIIGAGPVGLAAVKSFMERGHNVTAYEQQSSIGGLWNYQDDDVKEYAILPNDPRKYISGCYHSLIQNTSKLMTQFSDFPVPDSMPDILRHFEYFRYLQDYAKHFCLHDHIELNCTVIDLRQAPSSAASARDALRWEVHFERDGRSEMEIYDLVVVASSKFTRPSIPVYRGMEIFNNALLHSMQIRRDNVFKNKRVLVAGGGFSGTEMVCNALNANADIYWAVTGSDKGTIDHNHWAFSRFLESNGQPWDHNITRCGQPQEVFGGNGKLSTWLHPLNQCKTHPDPRYPGDGFAITDVPRINNAIQSGQIHLISSIDHFKETAVSLSDGTTLDNIDVVVFCTGYTAAFPFLDGVWDRKEQAKATFYRHMLPAQEQLQGIAFVGMTSSLPSLFPIAEMQSRWLAECWACRPLNNDGLLYSKKELNEFKAEIQERKESLLYREKFSFLFDSFGYTDMLAAELGCRPPAGEDLLENDEELASALMHAPLVSAHYRLVGKNAWPKAREYIIKMAKEFHSKDNTSDSLVVNDH
jgi:dimethylaniline monooxygenase (N-oxide forming)